MFKFIKSLFRKRNCTDDGCGEEFHLYGHDDGGKCIICRLPFKGSVE